MNIKNKKVFITGADGFIGSHLAESLVKEGCQVKAFVYYNSFNSNGWLDILSKDIFNEIEIFAGDVRDPNGIREAVKGSDIVFHLAALIGIPFSYHSPDSYVETNIRGTLNVLQASRDFAVKRIFVTSTSEVYGTAQYVPIDEKHPRQGQSPYSATKIAADSLAESFYRSFNLPVTIVRPFNTYGPRQSARAIIPTIITQILSGTDQIQLGSLHPTRDFVFVKDTVDAFVEIAKSDMVIGEEINIATQEEYSIKEIAEIIIDLVGSQTQIITDLKRIRPQMSEVERLCGNNEKIKQLTAWDVKYKLIDGLKETISWFKDEGHLQKYNPYVYNV